MRKIAFVVLFIVSFMVNAQTNTELRKHYEAFYKEMRTQADVNAHPAQLRPV